MQANDFGFAIDRFSVVHLRVPNETTPVAPERLRDQQQQMMDRLAAEPGVEAASGLAEPAEMLFVPLRLRLPDGTELSIFSTLATFGTALDVTLEELSIESFFPADAATRDYLRGN